MKTFCLIVFFQLLCAPLGLFAQEVTVVQSLRVRPYNEALTGFSSTCSNVGRKFVLAETPSPEILRRIREKKPRIILAIGGDALNSVRKITDVPIIYVMVAAQQAPAADEQANISGISLTIGAEKQLFLLEKALPSVKRVGVLYDPAKTGSFLKKAKIAAKNDGLELIAREVGSPKEIPTHLQSLKGSIDLFWMLPDTTVVTPETVEYLLLFSLENLVPIVTFSEKYVERGALLSFDIDPTDLGRQAGEMARRILAGTPISDIPPAGPRNILLTVNSKVARKLGKTISSDMLSRAKVY